MQQDKGHSRTRIKSKTSFGLRQQLRRGAQSGDTCSQGPLPDCRVSLPRVQGLRILFSPPATSQYYLQIIVLVCETSKLLFENTT